MKTSCKVHPYCHCIGFIKRCEILAKKIHTGNRTGCVKLCSMTMSYLSIHISSHQIRSCCMMSHQITTCHARYHTYYLVMLTYRFDSGASGGGGGRIMKRFVISSIIIMIISCIIIISLLLVVLVLVVVVVCLLIHI